MPELAEVEYYRRQWNGGLGKKVKTILLHPPSRNYRDCDIGSLQQHLVGSTLCSSAARGKQLLFRFSSKNWLGLHLGMSGKLAVATPPIAPHRHEHFVIIQAGQALVFRDSRQFGRIHFHHGKKAPDWWSKLPPPLISESFHRDALKAFLARHQKASIKAVLLMQERFPGIGNWMADEILWRARIRPACPAGRIGGIKLTQLYMAVKKVCREALEVIGTDWSEPPDTWLFHHRWRDHGYCPKTGKPLLYETIGGRTTCWSPAWQRWPQG